MKPEIIEELTGIAKLVEGTTEITLVMDRKIVTNKGQIFGDMRKEDIEFMRTTKGFEDSYNAEVVRSQKIKALERNVDISPFIHTSNRIVSFLFQALPEAKATPMELDVVQLRVRTDDFVSDHTDGIYLTASLNLYGTGTHSKETGINPMGSLLVFNGTFRAEATGTPALVHGGKSNPNEYRGNIFYQFDPKRNK